LPIQWALRYGPQRAPTVCQPTRRNGGWQQPIAVLDRRRVAHRALLTISGGKLPKTFEVEDTFECNLPLTNLNIYQANFYNFTFSQSLAPSLKFIKLEIGNLLMSHRQLQEIDRKIAEGRDSVIMLKGQIADLQKVGRTAIGTMGYLRELEHSLRLMSDYREVITRQLMRRKQECAS
jgi:hypothetical protein